MNPASFRSLCINLFGNRGWQIGCARFLQRDDGSHVDVRTVRRWARGDSRVPVAVAMLLRAEQASRVGTSSPR